MESGQSAAAAARSLGVIEQSLGNRVKAHHEGTLKGAIGKLQVSAGRWRTAACGRSWRV
jgi:transposase